MNPFSSSHLHPPPLFLFPSSPSSVCSWSCWISSPNARGRSLSSTNCSWKCRIGSWTGSPPCCSWDCWEISPWLHSYITKSGKILFHFESATEYHLYLKSLKFLIIFSLSTHLKLTKCASSFQYSLQVIKNLFFLEFFIRFQEFILFGWCLSDWVR